FMIPPKKSYSITEATTRLQGYRPYQDRCHKEVIAKLREIGMIHEAIDHIMGDLIRQKDLNEERFAKSFARGKFNIKKWGKNRIVNELKQREISKYNIDIALKEINDADYYTTFHTLAHKRLGEIREK